MRVLSVCGSPRRNGNTDQLLGELARGIRSTNRDNVTEVRLGELSIHPCRNCDWCRSHNDAFCVMQDDMQSLYSSFAEADLCILGSPIYWWSVSAQLKTFIDRLYGMNPELHPQLFKGKHLIIVLSYWGRDPNTGAEAAISMFKEIARSTAMTLDGVLRWASEGSNIQKHPEILREAFEMGVRVTRGMWKSISHEEQEGPGE